MIENLPPRGYFVAKYLTALVMLLLFNQLVMAKAAYPNAFHPRRLALPPPVNSIKIDKDAAVLALSLAKSATGYQIINLPLIISGKTPAASIKVKLLLQDRSQVSPLFYDNGISADNTIITISNDDFAADGSERKITVPVTLKVTAPDALPGSEAAYILITGKPEVYAINFVLKASATPATPATDSQVELAGNSIFTLDTLRDGVMNQYTVNVTLKLKAAITDDVTYTVVFSQPQPLSNLKLCDNCKPIEITLKKSDWDGRDAASSTITKPVTILLQQTKLVTAPQNLLLSLQNKDKVAVAGNYLFTFMPYAGKPNSLHLVKDGFASIMLSPDQKISQYYTSPVNTPDTIRVTVRLRGAYDPNANQLVFVPMDKALTKYFQIMENPVTITEEQWNRAVDKNAAIPPSGLCYGNIDIMLHVKLTNPIDSINGIHSLDLKIQGQSDAEMGSQKVKISILDRPFWAEIGSNFDVLDKVQTNNFYAGVLMFDKNVARFLTKKEGNKNVSFTGGVYEAQSVSSGSTATQLFYYRPVGPTPPFLRDTGSVNTATSVKSVGLFFSPHISILNTSRVDEDGFHPFVSLYIEMLWQRVTSNFDYSHTKALSQGNAGPNVDTSAIHYRQNSLSLDYRSHYFGIGLPFYIKHHDFTLYVNWVPLGMTTQQFVVLQNSDDIKTANLPIGNTTRYRPISNDVSNNYNPLLLNYARPRNNWNVFYLIQYRLTEVAYGLTFSGEIRSLYLQGSKPVITLALSKKFDLSQVLKPLVGKF